MQLEAIGFVLGAALFWAIASQLARGDEGLRHRFLPRDEGRHRRGADGHHPGNHRGDGQKEYPSEMLRFKPEAKAVWLAIAVAILTTLAGLFYYFALVKTDNKATTVIGVSTPMTLAFSALIGAVFFAEREKLTAVQWWGIVLAVCSVGMISWNQKMGKSEAVKVSPSPN